MQAHPHFGHIQSHNQVSDQRKNRSHLNTSGKVQNAKPGNSMPENDINSTNGMEQVTLQIFQLIYKVQLLFLSVLSVSKSAVLRSYIWAVMMFLNLAERPRLIHIIH